MPVCVVYVGSIDDPDFSWDPAAAKSPHYNLPRRLGPFFPPSQHLASYGAWSLLVRRIRSGEYDGRQVDWGGFAARMDLDGVRHFTNEVFPPDFTFGAPPEFPEMYAHLESQLAELRTFVDALAEGEYYLVASET